MKIKLDENLSRHLKDPLSEQGHDVSTALEEGLPGKVDTEVGAAAKGEDRWCRLKFVKAACPKIESRLRSGSTQPLIGLLDAAAYQHFD